MNSFYTFTPTFTPGTVARSDAVNTQYAAIETAFDSMPADTDAIVLGTPTFALESGSGNLYVVTMPNTRLANAEGDEVVFRAAHTNTGASTLNVDGLGAIALRRYDGTAVSSGEVVQGVVYTARYNAAQTRFEIIEPVQVTTVGAITYATPTTLVGLSASAGSASSLLRSDAVLALDQGIVPTWTGQHAWSLALRAPNGTAALPSYAFGTDTDNGMYLVGADNPGISAGGVLQLDISTLRVNSALRFRAPDGTAALPTYSFSNDIDSGLLLLSDGVVALAAAGAQRVTVSATEMRPLVPIITLGGSAADPAVAVGSTSHGLYTSGTALNVTYSGVLRLSLNATDIVSTLPWRGPNGNVGAPSQSFSGDTNTGAYNITADNYGIACNGIKYFDLHATRLLLGSDALYGQNGTAAAPFFTWEQDIDTGFFRDTANQIGIGLGGVTAGQIAQGSYTATAVGLTTSPTMTVSWQIIGKHVHLWTAGSVTGTSNSTAFSLSGAPAAITPAAASRGWASSCFTDSGTTGLSAEMEMSTGGTISFLLSTASGTHVLPSAAGWTGSGTKAVASTFRAVFPLT